MGCSVGKIEKLHTQLPSATGETYEFKIIFSNIKVKNLSIQNSYVVFSIDKTPIFKTSPITNNSNPHWKQSFLTTQILKSAQLKQSYFRISVHCSKTHNCLSTVSQLMNNVAIGPVHYDLFLESSKSKSSRITFDLRMVQKVQLRITTKKVFCELKYQLTEQAYNFQLKVRAHSVDYQSYISPMYYNPHLLRQKHQETCTKNFGFIDSNEKIRSDSDDFQLLSGFNFDKSMDENVQVDMSSFNFKNQVNKIEKKIIKKTSQFTVPPKKSQTANFCKKKSTMMDLILKKDVNWEFKSHDESPQICFDIYVDEFVTSSFEFILYGNGNVKDSEIESQNVRIVGNSIVSMNKFWSENVSVLAELEMLSVQEVTMIDKLWNHGQSVGRVKAEFIITNDPFMRQMLGGYMTEEGIQKSSSLYIKKDKYFFSNTENNQIHQICQINLQIDTLLHKLNQHLPHRDRVKVNQEINQIIPQLRTLVSNQDLYRNQLEMIRAQQVLTDLAKSLLATADDVDEDLRDPYYEVLILLLNRDEFYISYIGFEPALQEVWLQRKDPVYAKQNKKQIDYLEQKIRIALHYQNFLHKTLECATQKITMRVQNKMEQAFVFTFFVIAFFRIPKFQEMILDIFRKDSRKLNEYFEEELTKECVTDTQFSAEWGKNFYDYIKDEPRYKDHMQQLDHILQKSDWTDLVLNKGIFLRWLQLMLNHYRKAKLPYDMSISWKGFPGYLMLVRHLLLEIKYHNDNPYSDAIKEASNSMLENENILNYMVTVLFHKTKIYDAIAVYYALDMISNWFGVLKKGNKKVPTDFNYQFLMKGLFIIFDGQHSLSISKAIHLINEIFLQLPVEIQKEICDHLFDKCFFKFFMFWSKSVRLVFHHFLIYRIQHRLRNYRQESIRDIQKELECVRLEKQVQTLEEKTKHYNYLIYIKFSQLLEIAIRMKKILVNHSRQNEKVLQMQLEARYLKIRLMKKKQMQKNFTTPKKQEICLDEENPSNRQSNSIDFSFETYRRENNSLTSFSQQDPMFTSDARQSEQHDLEEVELNLLENEQSLNDHSFESLIDLDAILREIEIDKLQPSQGKKRNNNHHKKSFELNSQQTEEIKESKNHNKKKFTIYHRYVFEERPVIPKELMIYLIPAMHEWQDLQSAYKKWFLNIQSQLKRQLVPEAKMQQQLIEIEPPEIILLVPKDETEQYDQVNF